MSIDRDRAQAWFRELISHRGWALREVFQQKYTGGAFRNDFLAGITVGIIALPLAMALAIASGVPPQYGLYTSIVAGAIIAFLGGSRIAVSGPTAAFVVILAPISAQHGLAGLMIASVMAGFFLLLMGVGRLGQLIQFIPYPVTTGFTAGIGVSIATLQIKDFLGLQMEKVPSHFTEKVAALGHAVPTLRWEDTLIGALTLAILIVWPRVTRKVPGALIAAGVGATTAYILSRTVEGFEVSTIASRFSYTFGGETRGGIPPFPPSFVLPWTQPGPGGEAFVLSMDMLRDLLGPALAIAMLGAIESLLCAVVADGMAGTRHDPDAELIAQGVGNIVGPFFGGIAATGAIARTAANIRAGGRTPVAALVHSAFVLVAMLLLAPMLGYLPMASLAALLILVAWNMSDAKHFVHIMKVAPRSDVLVLMTCFLLTVIFDMVIAVTVGVVLAALLFMQRMASITQTRVLEETHHAMPPDMPRGVLVYEVAGPLFFGAAEKAMNTLARYQLTERPRVLVLNMQGVPIMDVTGLVALESVLNRAWKQNAFVIVSGAGENVRDVIRNAGYASDPGRLAFCGDLEQAAMLASLHSRE